VNAPIVILGPGRSGTTLLARTIAEHPDVAWFAGANDRWPHLAWVSLPSRIAALPLPSSTRDRIPRFTRIGETYGVWNAYFPGFSQAEREWTPADVTDAQVESFRAYVEAVRRWHGRPRFLAKITGWPRIELLRHVLPGVHLVHIDRDPRAVVASWIKQGWLGFKRNREAQAALSTEQLVNLYGQRYLDLWRAFRPFTDVPDVEVIRYEDLVASFVPRIFELCDALELRIPATFERRVREVEVRPAVDDWQAQLAPELLAALERFLEEPLAAGGYERAAGAP
jgi:hypothetical protein